MSLARLGLSPSAATKKQRGKIMPPIISIEKENEVILTSLLINRFAILKDGTEEFLPHPSEDFRIHDLKNKGVFSHEITKILKYDKDKDEFVFIDINDEGDHLESIVSLKEAEDKGYKIIPIGYS